MHRHEAKRELRRDEGQSRRVLRLRAALPPPRRVAGSPSRAGLAVLSPVGASTGKPTASRDGDATPTCLPLPALLLLLVRGP
ncbi:hypothetical protein E2562_020939 [Oryza meyeriana var. granulata]|uniref:Uncharacterized protein n=1 Tax=Oryza meyeriana var. granulata TaxID=110450 RepID=A0A6G1E0U7_9ORYZ|nr:hypothetical protein E2562_020939 [Oryza meyeriana var. granulata]